MFKECLIHLCDYTWLNVMYMLNYLLIKPKKISECFSCFWKVFCFEKFTKSKNLQLHILATHLQVASFMLQSQAQPEAFATTWRVKVLVEKKDLEFFFKIWVWGFLVTHFGDSFTSHEFVHRLLGLTSECKSQSRKRLREIFQNLGARDFGDSLGDSSAS